MCSQGNTCCDLTAAFINKGKIETLRPNNAVENEIRALLEIGIAPVNTRVPRLAILRHLELPDCTHRKTCAHARPGHRAMGTALLLSACFILRPVDCAAAAEEPATVVTANSSQPCAIDLGRISPAIRAKFAPDAMAKRNELFLRECQETNGQFIDSLDPMLDKRAVRPKLKYMPDAANYCPWEARHTHQPGRVDVLFIIEMDGSVSNVTPAQGKTLFVQAAVTVMKMSKFKTPTYLDGKPIRSLGYATIVFK